MSDIPTQEAAGAEWIPPHGISTANEGPSSTSQVDPPDWWPTVVSMLVYLAITAGILLWGAISHDNAVPEPPQTSDTPQTESANSTDSREPATNTTSETQATPAPVFVAVPEPPTPGPEVKPAASTSSGTHTNCSYLDGSWPMVGGKYVVRCDEGTFLATQGAYKSGGVYEFKDFEPHN